MENHQIPPVPPTMPEIPEPVSESPPVDELIVYNGSHKLSIYKNDGTISIAEYNEKELPPKPNITTEESVLDLKRKIYKDFISKNCQNLVILTGAGSSVSEGGPTMKDLWDCVTDKIPAEELDELGRQAKILLDRNSFREAASEKRDLEKLLSKLTIMKEFVTDSKKIEEFIEMAEKQIIKKCSLQLKADSQIPNFLKKISSRNLKFPRVKLFTLNYDTIFEQAARDANFVLIDGFSFSHPRKFTPSVYDLDIIYREKTRINDEPSFFPNVIQFYKPHGSLNWVRKGDSVFQVNELDDLEKPVLIYPQESKYENSYEQPFFEMMSRFQHALRQENTMLITIGFSFSDKHFRNSILEAVEQYPSFHLLVINKSLRFEGEMARITILAEKRNDVMLVAETFDDFIENFPAPSVYISNHSNPTLSDEPGI